jgi:hypothetical protein
MALAACSVSWYAHDMDQTIIDGCFVRHASHPGAEGLVVDLGEDIATVAWPDGRLEHPLDELERTARAPLGRTNASHYSPGRVSPKPTR